MTDIQMPKGDTQTFDVFVTRVNQVTGVEEIVPLAGARAWFTAKKVSTDSDANAIIAKDSVTDPSEVVITDVEGKVTITIIPADTVSYPGKYLEYDVQVKEVDGTVTTVQKGRLELGKNITVSTA
jgi:hypothetical protein